MYSIKAILQKEPAAIAGGIRAILHTLVLMAVIKLDAPQLAGISLMLEVVLTLFTRSNSTPTVTATANEANALAAGLEAGARRDPSPPA